MADDPGATELDDDRPSVGSADASPQRGGRWLLWLLVVVGVFVGGGAFYHLSTQNAGKWFLEVRGGEVVVRKGIWFPTGAADYDDGGPAYAPVPLPEGMAPPARVHDSPESVDNAIYRLLIALASSAIESSDAPRIESAKGLLSRARLLAGISQEQADDVLRYRGDIAMAEGHLAIRQVQALLARAKQRVEAGAAKGIRLYKDPQGWVRWINAKLAEFSSLDGAREPPVSLCGPDTAPTLDAPPGPSPTRPSPGAPSAGGPTAPAPALVDPSASDSLPQGRQRPRVAPPDAGLSFPLFPKPTEPEEDPASDPAPPAADEDEVSL